MDGEILLMVRQWKHQQFIQITMEFKLKRLFPQKDEYKMEFLSQQPHSSINSLMGQNRWERLKMTEEET